jgi:sugar lactone lactonase YvrE
MTVIADSYDGKPLNSPSGVAPHPDGSIWFTDPGYGDQLAEGHPDEAGGSTNPQGILNLRIGASDAGVRFWPVSPLSPRMRVSRLTAAA